LSLRRQQRAVNSSQQWQHSRSTRHNTVFQPPVNSSYDFGLRRVDRVTSWLAAPSNVVSTSTKRWLATALYTGGAWPLQTSLGSLVRCDCDPMWSDAVISHTALTGTTTIQWCYCIQSRQHEKLLWEYHIITQNTTEQKKNNNDPLFQAKYSSSPIYISRT